jgi:hypothetical protein
MSMDLTPWVFGTARFDWEMQRKVSIWFGLGVIILAWISDYRERGGDFAFWLHLFAVGLIYHRKQETIATWLAAHLPGAVLRLRPAHAR